MSKQVLKSQNGVSLIEISLFGQGQLVERTWIIRGGKPHLRPWTLPPDPSFPTLEAAERAFDEQVARSR